MATRKRWLHDDGRDGTKGDAPGCLIPRLDKIPSDELPKEVDTVFFGGGWFPLAHWKWNQGFKDAHYVCVSPFYISLWPVSIGQWKELMGPYEKAHIWEFGCEDHQPAQADWKDAIDYCNKLSAREGLEPCYSEGFDKYGVWEVSCDWNANGYRLPTEAELNYATPAYVGRLPRRPAPSRRRPDKDELECLVIGLERQLNHACRHTIVWDVFDHRYFRESPKFDPTGPKEGCGHSHRVYPAPQLPLQQRAQAVQEVFGKHQAPVLHRQVVDRQTGRPPIQPGTPDPSMGQVTTNQ